MKKRYQSKFRLMVMVLKKFQVNEDAFYTMSIGGLISLQGDYNYEIVRKFMDFKPKIDDNGFVSISVGKYLVITLT